MGYGEIDPQIILVNGELASLETLDDLNLRAFSILDYAPRSYVSIFGRAFGDCEFTLEHSFHEEDNLDAYAIDLGFEYDDDVLCTIDIVEDAYTCNFKSASSPKQVQEICSELLQSFTLDANQEKIVLLASDYIAKVSGVPRDSSGPTQTGRDFSELKDLIRTSIKENSGLFYVERDLSFSLGDVEPDFLGVTSCEYYPPVDEDEDTAANDRLQVIAGVGSQLYDYRVSQWGVASLETGFHPLNLFKDRTRCHINDYAESLEKMRVMAGFYEPGEQHANSLRYIIEAARQRDSH